MGSVGEGLVGVSGFLLQANKGIAQMTARETMRNRRACIASFCHFAPSKPFGAGFRVATRLHRATRGSRALYVRCAEATLHRSPRSRRRACSAAASDRKSTRLNSSHVKISYAVF